MDDRLCISVFQNRLIILFLLNELDNIWTLLCCVVFIFVYTFKGCFSIKLLVYISVTFRYKFSMDDRLCISVFQNRLIILFLLNELDNIWTLLCCVVFIFVYTFKGCFSIKLLVYISVTFRYKFSMDDRLCISVFQNRLIILFLLNELDNIWTLLCCVVFIFVYTFKGCFSIKLLFRNVRKRRISKLRFIVITFCNINPWRSIRYFVRNMFKLWRSWNVCRLNMKNFIWHMKALSPAFIVR